MDPIPNASSSKKDDARPPGFIDFFRRRSVSDELHDRYNWSCPEQDDAPPPPPPGFIDFFNQRSAPDELHNKQSEDGKKDLKEDYRPTLDESHERQSEDEKKDIKDDNRPALDESHERHSEDEKKKNLKEDIRPKPDEKEKRRMERLEEDKIWSMSDDCQERQDQRAASDESHNRDSKCMKKSRRGGRLMFDRSHKRHLGTKKKNFKKDQRP